MPHAGKAVPVTAAGVLTSVVRRFFARTWNVLLLRSAGDSRRAEHTAEYILFFAVLCAASIDIGWYPVFWDGDGRRHIPSIFLYRLLSVEEDLSGAWHYGNEPPTRRTVRTGCWRACRREEDGRACSWKSRLKEVAGGTCIPLYRIMPAASGL